VRYVTVAFTLWICAGHPGICAECEKPAGGRHPARQHAGHRRAVRHRVQERVGGHWARRWPQHPYRCPARRGARRAVAGARPVAGPGERERHPSPWATSAVNRSFCSAATQTPLSSDPSLRAARQYSSDRQSRNLPSSSSHPAACRTTAVRLSRSLPPTHWTPARHLPVLWRHHGAHRSAATLRPRPMGQPVRYFMSRALLCAARNHPILRAGDHSPSPPSLRCPSFRAPSTRQIRRHHRPTRISCLFADIHPGPDHPRDSYCLD
jgi:hypothetical protein